MGMGGKGVMIRILVSKYILAAPKWEGGGATYILVILGRGFVLLIMSNEGGWGEGVIWEVYLDSLQDEIIWYMAGSFGVGTFSYLYLSSGGYTTV